MNIAVLLLLLGAVGFSYLAIGCGFVIFYAKQGELESDTSSGQRGAVGFIILWPIIIGVDVAERVINYLIKTGENKRKNNGNTDD